MICLTEERTCKCQPPTHPSTHPPIHLSTLMTHPSIQTPPSATRTASCASWRTPRSWWRTSGRRRRRITGGCCWMGRWVHGWTDGWRILTPTPTRTQNRPTSKPTRPPQNHQRYATSSPRRPEGDYADLLPWLLDQTADFEAAAAAGAPTTPPLPSESPPSAPPRYRLFSVARGGCAGCARALLRAAETQSVNKDLRAAAKWVPSCLALSCLVLSCLVLPCFEPEWWGMGCQLWLCRRLSPSDSDSNISVSTDAQPTPNRRLR
jgi:hypothetical protein